MKNMKIKTLIFVAAMMLVFSIAKTQTTNNWQLAAIGMDGTNGYKGVDVYYQLTTCNSAEVIVLKIINTNAYAVKAQWINAIATNDNKDLYGKSKLVSYKLPSKGEAKGDCNDKTGILSFKLSDYGIKASDLRIFVGSNFDVTNN